MNLINVKEKKLLQEWAAKNSDREVFDQRSNFDTDSYFITRSSEDTYIVPYKFESIPQLQEKIVEVCGEKIDMQQQKLLCVAAFKCRVEPNKNFYKEEKSITSGKLPEFTYAL